MNSILALVTYVSLAHAAATEPTPPAPVVLAVAEVLQRMLPPRGRISDYRCFTVPWPQATPPTPNISDDPRYFYFFQRIPKDHAIHCRMTAGADRYSFIETLRWNPHDRGLRWKDVAPPFAALESQVRRSLAWQTSIGHRTEALLVDDGVVAAAQRYLSDREQRRSISEAAERALGTAPQPCYNP